MKEKKKALRKIIKKLKNMRIKKKYYQILKKVVHGIV